MSTTDERRDGDDAIRPFAEPGARYRHRRGGTYRLVLLATSEATGEPVAAYLSESDPRRLWVWPLAEFCDGRFERIGEDEPVGTPGPKEAARGLCVPKSQPSEGGQRP